MRLNKLEIKGFKSFGDKAIVNFNKGVTAIVGPNGCGKSNVIDAIRWVLGEQSTKALRSEKMENIIFNGTKNRKAAQLAEVSLTFDNTKNILPTAYSQVTITRKLYRSGESEYRLNDVLCRLKDITDLFLDTGIGSDSYAIIELKMIDEIIVNKENSRRALFEEASGISKYKLRKKQTFAKLKDTEADLSRVDDLLFEITKNLKVLESQAKKAEKYKLLKDNYKTLSIQFSTFKIDGFSKWLQNLEAQENKFNNDIASATAKLEVNEAQIQRFKLNYLTEEKNLTIQQKATNNFIAKIKAYENENKIKNQQLLYLNDKKNRVIQEIDKDKNQLNHVLYNQKRLLTEKITEEELLFKIINELALLKENIDTLKTHHSVQKAELDAFNQQNNTLQSQIYQTEKERDILQIQKDTLFNESLRNTQDAATKNVELNDFNAALSNFLLLQTTAKNELHDALFFEETLDKKIQDTENIIAILKETLNANIRKLDARQNEYNLTKSLVDNLEGYPQSIRFLKKNTVWKKPAPLFSDILFCKEAYRVAIENYVEPLMNYYVVNNYNEAIDAIKLLNNSSAGKAGFFILQNYHGLAANTNVKIPENAISALDVLEVDVKYKNLCAHLFQHVYLVNDDVESNLNDNLVTNDVVILAKSGRFSKTKYTLSGGSIGLFEGKRIGRAKNLEMLAKEIKTLDEESEKLKIKIQNIVSGIINLKISSKKTEITTLQNTKNKIDNQIISVQTKQQQYQSFIQKSNNVKQDIEIKIANISESLLNINPKLLALKQQQELLQQQIFALQTTFSTLSETISTQSADYNAKNIKFYQQQNKVNSIVKDIDYRQSQQKNLQIQLDKRNAELQTTMAEITQLCNKTSLQDAELIALYQQKTEMENGLQSAEKTYYSLRGTIADTENLQREFRKQKETATYLLNEVKDKKTALKIELNSLKERLSLEFNIDIEELWESQIPENETEDSLKVKIEKLKSQIADYGAVNPTAMEAYKEISQRYSFIIEQKTDLLRAKKSLLQTISEIDNTAKDKFMQSFTLVRDNFIKVFRSLFNEEDSCDLLLSDEANPLESDINVIARPKGKRPLTINQLSGGEKTLTAIALLFSLYLLKPAPFCIFDEVDAPLDDSNIDKFNNIIREFSADSQFIIVSHNKKTIAFTDIIYGVIMIEQGVSKLVAVDLTEH
ncbi:MAG: chromosome segregation protein SMC [Sphingobacteriales bacterium]|nr:MAG: chromosome segregation protein SMC [Sphingobacteriales bacterium]TAF79461.1 MAG: chromosome segregation protein SMC [Sphingobacteriales bacterium]